MFDFEKGGDLFFNKKGKLVRKPMPSPWQPIETVPHNTKVLVWRSGPPSHAEYLTSAWYGQSCDEHSPRWHNYTDGPFAFAPSHWMPLPAPPEES